MTETIGDGSGWVWIGKHTRFVHFSAAYSMTGDHVGWSRAMIPQSLDGFNGILLRKGEY